MAQHIFHTDSSYTYTKGTTRAHTRTRTISTRNCSEIRDFHMVLVQVWVPSKLELEL